MNQDNNIKRLLHRYGMWLGPYISSRIILYLLAFVAVVGMLLWFGAEVPTYTSPMMRMVIFTGDAVLLLAPFWLFSNRGARSVLVLVWLLWLFLFVNTLYYRYWGDLAPFNCVLTPAIYNSAVIKCIPGLLRNRDILELLIPLLLTLYVVFLYRPESSVEIPVVRRLLYVLCSVVLYVLIFCFTSYRIGLYIDEEEIVPVSVVSVLRLKPHTTNIEAWHCNGIVPYVYVQTKEAVKAGRIENLTPEESRGIEELLGRTGYRSGIVSANRNKNLIFIVVESLNSGAVGYEIGGESITPVLDSLIRGESIVAMRMLSETLHGNSSDGQLMYNTGLYPERRLATALTFGYNTYPSLAKILGKKVSVEYIVEKRRVWNHAVTNMAYGYDELYDSDSLHISGLNLDEIGADRAVFAMALQNIKQLQQPFFAFVTTYSMHSPYRDAHVEIADRIMSNDVLPELTKRYYGMLNYFDEELGRFLNELDSIGILDNSVVVIAADHSSKYLETTDVDAGYIPLIVVNAGIDKKVEGSIRQIDVFPTIVDLMGVDVNGYGGLGVSILHRDYDSLRRSVAQESLLQTSERILHSDYFGRR